MEIIRFLNPVVPVSMLRRPASAASLPPVAITDQVKEMLAQGAVVAVGVSGGKDSQAAAIATADYLKSIGHSGPKVLVHADLGRVEWRESLPVCDRLAERLGWELLTVRRQAGDMMDRWNVRWENNVARYRDLSCVKLILPWSTPSMRFCTSELKVAVITSALKKRYPEHDIVNVSGIRREESAPRAKMPIAAPEAKLTRRSGVGYNWNPIIEWKLDEVLASIEGSGLELHEAYTKYNMSRVSCAFCIMSSEGDLIASAGCADNVDILLEMVGLEVRSTFAFQGHRWLADTAPHLLPFELKRQVEAAKRAAVQRQAAERRIPDHLLYAKGWPTRLPTQEEARLLAEVRREVAEIMNLSIAHTTADSVRDRYADLLRQKAAKLDGAPLPEDEDIQDAQLSMFAI
jgi:3'-phosphoadenosine 5'-phosphosulfate sulfotransferase (PAPS reductase)/FAD synthetase